ncbi:MAG: hypothetical protein HZA35_03980 [Parcubacteria group bacterium]|nr:hypothetical protein [Parcubacteria group bacterium]
MGINIYFLVGYIVCGILAYGIQKNNWRQFFVTLEFVGYDITAELMCITCGLLGYYGFIIILGTVLMDRFMFDIKLKPGLCYKMPKELLNSTRKTVPEEKWKQLEDKITELEQEVQKEIQRLKEFPPSQRPIGRG